MELVPGVRVRHRACDGWGVGVVRGCSNGRFLVFFEFAGAKTIADPGFLRVVIGDEAVSSRLDNLAVVGQGRTPPPPLSADELVRRFLARYSEGFRDPRYVEDERNYKLAASTLASQLIGPDVIAELAADRRYDEIARRALRCLRATNLLHPRFEVPALERVLADADRATTFASGLSTFIGGLARGQTAFAAFIDTLDRVGVTSWPLATYFPLLLAPTEHVFVRPTDVQRAAEALSFELHYQPHPNWRTYQAVLRLMTCIRHEIRRLNPLDMIDVQSFIWITTHED